MMFQFAVVVCAIHVFYSAHLSCQAWDLDMMSDSFDDQYICCENKMEREIPKILEEEKKKYKDFGIMWEIATNKWSNMNLKVPASFKDEYGVAIILYTMRSPQPIYEQLNRNVSIAGKSQDYYMKNFHFKALHFYLTRALQVLRKGSAKCITTYRGSKEFYTLSSSVLRFGQFASSSHDKNIAANTFGTNTFLTITTCFGVDISEFSDYKYQQEVLIPVSEQFYNIKRSEGNEYTLESTGQLCSYFDCAYFGEEKKPEPLCRSDKSVKTGGNLNSPVCNSGTFPSSGSRSWLFFGGLIMNVVIILLY